MSGTLWMHQNKTWNYAKLMCRNVPINLPEKFYWLETWSSNPGLSGLWEFWCSDFGDIFRQAGFPNFRPIKTSRMSDRVRADNPGPRKSPTTLVRPNFSCKIRRQSCLGARPKKKSRQKTNSPLQLYHFPFY